MIESVQMTERKTYFSLKGGGTKKIPVSRPQLIVGGKTENTRVMLIYRDIDYNNKIVLTVNQDNDFEKWKSRAITEYSVGSWEPSYDTELWKQKKKLQLYVQKVGQGDGETLEKIRPQYIKIQEIEIE